VVLVQRTAVIAAATVLAFTALTACSGGDDSAGSASSAPAQTPGGSTGSPTSTATRNEPTGADLKPVVTGVIAGGFTSPWGLAFLPDGSALVSERDTARIKRVTAAGRVTTVGQVPGVVPGGEGGLLGLAISPDFDQDHWLYAYFTSDRDNRIVRMKYSNGELGTPHPVLTGIAKAGIHNGGRIGFGPDGMLYAGVGEAGLRSPAQDLHSLSGKILRMTPTGKPAPHNPFGNSVVWTYGHRNPQGFTWDDKGRMWASEFGQNTWDELNLIQRGRNYGWPVVEGKADNNSYVNPVVQWHTDEASPSGVVFAKSAIYMAALRGSRLWQIPLNGTHAGKPRDYFVNKYGRLRTVVVAPDGSLWLTTSNTDGRGAPRTNDDKILRIALRPQD
jgi:glucose/arabinose dehydrogenase